MKFCQLHEGLGPDLFVIRITPQRTKELDCLLSPVLIARLRDRSIGRVSVVCSCRIGQEHCCVVGFEKWKLFALSLETILWWQADGPAPLVSALSFQPHDFQPLREYPRPAGHGLVT